jgi:hypothetical protein
METATLIIDSGPRRGETFVLAHVSPSTDPHSDEVRVTSAMASVIPSIDSEVVHGQACRPDHFSPATSSDTCRLTAIAHAYELDHL